MISLASIVSAYANEEEGRDILNRASALPPTENPQAAGLKAEALMQHFYKVVTDRYGTATGNAGVCQPFEINLCLLNDQPTSDIFNRISKTIQGARPSHLKAVSYSKHPHPLSSQMGVSKPHDTSGPHHADFNPPPSHNAPTDPSSITPSLSSPHVLSNNAIPSGQINPVLVSQHLSAFRAGQLPPSASLPVTHQDAQRTIGELEAQILSKATRVSQLQHELNNFKAANDAYEKFEREARALIDSQGRELSQLRKDNQQLRARDASLQSQHTKAQQMLAQVTATNNALNAELEMQKGLTRDTMRKYNVVNANSMRFREDLWHSEMRWRDASNRVENLTAQMGKMQEAHKESFKNFLEKIREKMPNFESSNSLGQKRAVTVLEDDDEDTPMQGLSKSASATDVSQQRPQKRSRSIGSQETASKDRLSLITSETTRQMQPPKSAPSIATTFLPGPTPPQPRHATTQPLSNTLSSPLTTSPPITAGAENQPSTSTPIVTSPTTDTELPHGNTPVPYNPVETETVVKQEGVDSTLPTASSDPPAT